jgi:arylsulfatase A-like enzyme
MDLNHIVFIIMDSCRFDSFVAARTPNIDRIGVAGRRFSYASWTVPSHHAFAMGLMPHTSPVNVFASEVYKEEYSQWRERTGHAEIAFKEFLPELSLPKLLRGFGYRTVAKVSMPVLNKSTLISRDFDEYKLMPHHNNFDGMIDEMEFPDGEPHFYFLNLGETHYPYMLDGSKLPRVSGVHGTLKAMDEAPGTAAESGFDQQQMQAFRLQQIKCVEYVDGQIGRLMSMTPGNTHFIVTADHGELFGEEGYFGHGPIMHEKCFEVPFVEGRVAQPQ